MWRANLCGLVSTAQSHAMSAPTRDGANLMELLNATNAALAQPDVLASLKRVGGAEDGDAAQYLTIFPSTESESDTDAESDNEQHDDGDDDDDDERRVRDNVRNDSNGDSRVPHGKDPHGAQVHHRAGEPGSSSRNAAGGPRQEAGDRRRSEGPASAATQRTGPVFTQLVNRPPDDRAELISVYSGPMGEEFDLDAFISMNRDVLGGDASVGGHRTFDDGDNDDGSADGDGAPTGGRLRSGRAPASGALVDAEDLASVAARMGELLSRTAVDADEVARFRAQVHEAAREQQRAEQERASTSRELFQLVTSARKAKLDRFASLLQDAVAAEAAAAARQEAECRTAAKAVYVPLLKFQRLYAWQAQDLARAMTQTRETADRREARVAARLQRARAEDRAKMGKLIAAWEMVARQYVRVLARAFNLVKQLAATEHLDHEETKEACRSAGVLLEAVRDILEESTAKVRASLEPDDAFHALSVLKHAIRESQEHVRRLLRVSNADRPHFDPARFEELSRSLEEAQRDKDKAEAELSGTTDKLRDARAEESALTAQGGGMGGVAALVRASRATAELERAAAGADARVAASGRLTQVLSAQLRDARIQKVLAKLDEVCAKQAKWLDACAVLSRACERAETVLTQRYDKLHAEKRDVRSAELEHLKRLQAQAERRTEDNREVLTGVVGDVLQRYVRAVKARAAAATKRRADALAALDQAGEFYARMADAASAKSREDAERIAYMLGNFHSTFAELCAAHDHGAVALDAWLAARTLAEAAVARQDGAKNGMHG